MHTTPERRPLRVAVSFGATHGQLANLLACQRAEEPDTPIAFSEAFLAEQFAGVERSEEHTSELQSLMRISYAVFCLKKNKTQTTSSMRHNSIRNYHTLTMNP